MRKLEQLRDSPTFRGQNLFKPRPDWFPLGGGQGAGARENRGWEGYGRRERKGREAGDLRGREAGGKCETLIFF